MKVIELNQQNLAEISSKIPCPSYDRDNIKTGIVHIGVGGFHRAHQAYYIHQLLNKSQDLNWGICGVGIRAADRKMYDTLKKQNGLYTLVIQHPDGTNASEVIGSIKEMLLAVDDPILVINKMAHAETKIVSLTITEGGYNFDQQTGEFQFQNLDVLHDMSFPNSPKTVFGFLTSALKKRRDNGLAPFTIMSCDNIPHNGDVTRKMVLSFAKKQDPTLAQWIEKEVTFPNSMVDRITPVTNSTVITYLESELQLKDEWPVICEPFIQWVVEDKFVNGRPPLEQFGVQFVERVAPYEKMKIRLLNAGHSVLGIPGALHGHEFIFDCMKDPIFARFMRLFMDKEVTPVLEVIEGVNFEEYKNSLEHRFSNPNIKDQVSRICSESSAKLPKFLIPTIQDNLANNGSIEYATFILAAWCFYSSKAVNEKGAPLEIIDTAKKDLHKQSVKTKSDPLAFLQLKNVFGTLANNERFTSVYQKQLQLIYEAKSIRELMSKMI